MYDPLMLEVWAIVDGLKSITSQGFHSIIVESNGITAIKFFRTEKIN